MWDAFFYEGSKVIFRAALTIMANLNDKLMSKKDLGSILETFKVIHSKKGERNNLQLDELVLS